MNRKIERSKILLIVLLFCTSILTVFLLITLPAPQSSSNLILLNEKIDEAIEHAGIQTDKLNKSIIIVDSTFSRSTYQIPVPHNFSKTTFHINLHQQLIEYGITCPAKFRFPENNMDIFVTYNNTVFNTIKLVTSHERDQGN